MYGTGYTLVRDLGVVWLMDSSGRAVSYGTTADEAMDGLAPEESYANSSLNDE